MKLLSDPKYVALTKATWSIFDEYQHEVASSHWRPRYHISPVAGLLNDPNGFCFFNNEYHLFYQWYPFGIAHGMKHWAHVKSDDLVNWSSPTLAMTPDTAYDARGVYSGAAYCVTQENGEQECLLYFTGNLKYENDIRDATQCVATLSKDGVVTKSDKNPLIPAVPAGYSGHVRDPKVFAVGNEYRMLLGAQTEQEKGCVLVYRSDDAMAWELMGELDVRFTNDDDIIGGYMWECPDFFELDGRDVLVFSPQGVAPQGERFRNEFNVVYCLGRADWRTLTFDVEVMQELDRGFDFYAAQTMDNHPFGERILSAWAGCGDPDYPSDREGWSNCLTFPRALTIQDNQLCQRPVDAIQALYAEHQQGEGMGSGMKALAADILNRYRFTLTLDGVQRLTTLSLLATAHESLDLIIDADENRITLDRSGMSSRFAKQWGEQRSVFYPVGETLEIDVLIDGSIAEIFIDGGRLAFTARVFPQSPRSQIELHSTSNIHYRFNAFEISPSVNTAPITAEALVQLDLHTEPTRES
ncbi:glycoside hydrolase family 32 protein [Enterovibrio sp. 27052020O]|uniref:glycoside hydrolase family 32 protein n=1 Tax=Enterovibrio sp. 27052020O TaxID=3241166 RepID=UPI003890E14B